MSINLYLNSKLYKKCTVVNTFEGKTLVDELADEYGVDYIKLISMVATAQAQMYRAQTEFSQENSIKMLTK